jgi:hypothetical protein
MDTQIVTAILNVQVLDRMDPARNMDILKPSDELRNESLPFATLQQAPVLQPKKRGRQPAQIIPIESINTDLIKDGGQFGSKRLYQHLQSYATTYKEYTPIT